MLIIHENKETGGICITKPVNDSIDEALAKAVPEDVPYFIVKDSFIPDDYTFRNAWVIDFNSKDSVIEIDLEKAKLIAADILRQGRDEKLQIIEGKMVTAFIGGDTAKLNDLKAQKQALLDITEPAKTAQSIDELKALIG